MRKKIRLTLRTKLLVFEYKERFPTLSSEHISEVFNINHSSIVNLFDVGEIIVPSKFNKK